MSDPVTTDLPVLDHFRGGEGLLELSVRLMDWYEAPITDEEIGRVLGPELVPAFRYAQSRLLGKVRKVTLEPAFCHSADVAFRAAELGYPAKALMTCLLHDVVEDVCKTVSDMPKAMRDLQANFPEDVVHDVGVLTNRYQLIFKQAKPKVRPDIPIERRSLRAFRSALDVLRCELPQSIADTFSREFDQLANYLDSEVDISEAIKIASRDRKFTLATFLERKVYYLYIEDMIARAAEQTLRSNGKAPVTALVVKFMDLTDNIRTSEVSNRLALFKLVNKAETVIDAVQRGFIEKVPGEVAARTTIPTVHRMVQVRLVDQFKLRRRAVANNFSETRFTSLVGFLAEHANRLVKKYGIPPNRVELLSDLEEQVRAWNRARLTY